MATEEFTFPIISGDMCPSSIDSPPLWRLSPAASPDPRLRRNEEGYRSQAKPKTYKQRKSCSDIVNNKEDQNEEEDEEEKMDLLWEDFNEELCFGKSRLEAHKSRSDKDMVELGCVQALKFSKTSIDGSAIFSSSPRNTKPGLVVFIRSLKRIFLLHNTHHHHHHHHHHQQHKSVKNRIR